MLLLGSLLLGQMMIMALYNDIMGKDLTLFTASLKIKLCALSEK